MDKLLNLIAAAALLTAVFMLVNEASAYDSTPDQVVTMPVEEDPTTYTECSRRRTGPEQHSFADLCRFTPDGDWYLMPSRGGVVKVGKLEIKMEAGRDYIQKSK